MSSGPPRVIGVGMLNGIANKSVSLAELLAVNAIIAGLVTALELGSLRSRDVATPMFYDRLELLRPEARAELEADLAKRTGFVVSHVEVHSVDLLRDSAEATVYHCIRSSTGADESQSIGGIQAPSAAASSARVCLRPILFRLVHPSSHRWLPNEDSQRT
jgi:hypothetical protein